MTRHYLPIGLFIAALAIVAMFWRARRENEQLARVGIGLAAALVPRALAVATFLAGAVLLFSGATPPVRHRLFWLDHLVPLPVVESAHFFGSITGIGLLLLARGIQRRLDAAYVLTLALLGGGALFSLLKGFDYEEAALLLGLILLLAPNRRFFYRSTSIIEERFTRGWIIAISLIVVSSVLLGYLTHHQIAGRMLWEFELDRTAPRFLRATVGVLLVLIVFAGAHLIRPARARVPSPSRHDVELARSIAADAPDASSQLVLLGDKSILFAPSGQSFLMYALSGRSWVALGDPVGSAADASELVSEFINRAVRAAGWPVFYKVSREQIGLYLDFGLSVVKLGEEARVPLHSFSLDGPERRNLRRVWRKAVDDGCGFEVLQDRTALEPLLPELRAISDEWLLAKHAREKRFSLGRFREDYLLRFPVGVVRRSGQLVAFASAWLSGGHAEIEVDLMRHRADAPSGVMRYLLTEFMLWGRENRYEWFNLGMAPLSGLRDSLIAPLWYQVGIALYGTAERFYNFQGIRAFKEWFYPRWEPKYLANPGGVMRPVVMANIAALVAGGYEGVLRR